MTTDVNQKIRADPFDPCQSVFYSESVPIRVLFPAPPRCGDAALLRGRRRAAGTQHRCGDAAPLRGRSIAAGTPPRCGDAAPLRPYYSTVYSPSTTPSSLPFFAPAPSPPALV
jgi:hypothetical protein